MPKNLPIIESGDALMDSDSDVERIIKTKGMKAPRHSNHDMKLDSNDAASTSFRLKTMVDRSIEKF
jgi:hypothetical protein